MQILPFPFQTDGQISTLNHLPTTLHILSITLIHTSLRLQRSEFSI